MKDHRHDGLFYVIFKVYEAISIRPKLCFRSLIY